MLAAIGETGGERSEMSAPEIERAPYEASEVDRPLYDLEHLSTHITEWTRYRVSLNGQEIGVIGVVDTNDKRYWRADGSLIRFQSQPEAIAWLVELRRAN